MEILGLYSRQSLIVLNLLWCWSISGEHVLAQTAATASAGKKYILVSEPSQTVTATLKYRVSHPDLTAQEWVVFAAVAPQLPSQANTSTKLNHNAVEVNDEGPFHHKLLMANVQAKDGAYKSEIPINVTYHATLRSRRLKLIDKKDASREPPALNERQAERFTASSTVYDFDEKSFKKWINDLGFSNSGHENEVDFARRVYRGLLSAKKYRYSQGMKRNASEVCKSDSSDCGGLSNLFVATMRASGIPARTLYGRWAQSAEKNSRLGGVPYYQWHVKAEFFAKDVGWIPVDVASGLLDKTGKPLQFFGVDPGDFITFHLDSDLSVDTTLFGVKPIHSLQYPAYWVKGNGSLKRVETTEEWTVRKSTN